MKRASTVIARAAIGILLVHCQSIPAAENAVAGRALRLDDLYSEAHLPDPKDWSLTHGGALAINIDRPANTRRVWDINEADIWVQLSPGEKPFRIADGAGDHSDWRVPAWSPDGTRLLLQSNRGGARRLWVWERADRTLRPIGEQTLFQVTREGWSHFYDWIDDRYVLAMVLPPGVKSAEETGAAPEPMARARAGWQTFLAGREPSVSVVATGGSVPVAPPDAGSGPQRLRQLVRIDVVTGRSTTVTETYRPPVNDIWISDVSPDGLHVVVPQYGPAVSNHPNDIAGSLTLAVRRTDGVPMKLDRPLPGDVLWQTQRWSPDGWQLAYLSFGASRVRPPRLVLVDVRRGSVVERDLGNLVVANIRDDQWDFARLEWTETGELVCQAGQGEDGLKKYARRDWWLIAAKGSPHPLTLRMDAVPQLQRLSRSGPLVGVASGRLWRLDAARRTLHAVTDASQSISAIAWPLPLNERRSGSASRRASFFMREDWSPEGYLVVQSGKDSTGGKRYSKLELRTGHLISLTPPVADAVFVRLDTQGRQAYWMAKPMGQQRFAEVWVTATQTPSPARPLFQLNTWQDGILKSHTVHLNYRSLFGEPFTARLQLPHGYRPGRRYPTIVNIYPGQSSSSRSANRYDELAAAMGYAVLVPHMRPSKGQDRMYGMVTRDMFFEVPNGVLPAVEQGVVQGLVDPDRLFVEGQSAGGFATYALIEQTPRFRAAIATAAISNWSNGSFSSRARYSEDVAKLGIGWMNENIQQRPSVETQWSDLGLFLRNSPITYAERIQTPLMMVHGDQDSNVPMSDSEEMFSAMVQLRKRAEFVRYWGERHVVEMPANVRDLWQRRFAWFDEFGDIARDAGGEMTFEGEQVRSRSGEPALLPAAYLEFDFFKLGGAR